MNLVYICESTINSVEFGKDFYNENLNPHFPIFFRKTKSQEVSIVFVLMKTNDFFTIFIIIF